ncbi:MAG: AMP-binding protein [Candidatus Wallbacteria bacterium]|nr:AMP-binding protein [Candidatus Wallbacteria bacterium]
MPDFSGGSPADPSKPDATHNSFFLAFERFPERCGSDVPALIEPLGAEGGGVHHRVVSYRQLFEEVDRLADALLQVGIGPGDRVLLMVPMSVELYTAILAVLRIGAVVLFIDPADGIHHLDRTAASMAPKAFIAVPRAHVFRLLSGAIRRIPIQVSTWPTFLGWTMPWSELLARGRPGVQTAPVLPTDPAMISFTSGSSGTPKGVCRSHRDLRAIFAMLCGHEGKRQLGVNLCGFPVLPLDDLSAGRSCLLPRAEPGKLALARPTDLADQLRQFPPTLISLPPGLLRGLVDHCAATKERFPTLRHVFTGGGVVPISLVRDARAAFPDSEFHILYGSTEAEPVSMIDAPEILAETAARTEAGEGMCVGRIAPDTRVLVVEQTDGPLESLHPATGIGEIFVSGGHVNRAYFNDPVQTRLHKFQDSSGDWWHRMGDLGWMDSQGRLWLVGRASNQVRTPEKLLHPVKVEPVFDALPGVRKSALVGVPVVIAGIPQTAAALLVELAPAHPDPAAVIEEIRRTIRVLELPIRVVRTCERILYDRRIGAKIQYAALADAHGEDIRRELGDPLILRMTTYRRERFPLPRHAFVSLLFAAAVARGVSEQTLSGPVALAALAVLAFFWHMRVLDEHQDFEKDRVRHPGRAVARGVVSLRELAHSARLAALAEAAIAMVLGLVPFGWWCFAAAYSLAMRVDFFAPKLFEGRPVLRGLTHAPLAALLTQFLAAAAGAPTPVVAPAIVAALIAPLSGVWWRTAAGREADAA